MVIQILTLILCIICALIFPFLAWIEIRQFNIEREAWRVERKGLLDRIQAGSFTEYKAQERADIPLKRKEKDPEKAKWESESWA